MWHELNEQMDVAMHLHVFECEIERDYAWLA